MTLPFIDIFEPPFEAWESRRPTLEEMLDHRRLTNETLLWVNDRCSAVIRDPWEAARYIAEKGADEALGRFVNRKLDESLEFRLWRRAMPNRTPPALAKYRREYPHCDLESVNDEVNLHGFSLSEGQCLFHGGRWPGGNADAFVTTRVLSTSFCPQVALRNADHLGKAYDQGKIDLLVLRATEPCTKTFAFKRAGAGMGHENEVLIASGARMVVHSRTRIRDDYLAMKWQEPEKRIPVFVFEIDIE